MNDLMKTATFEPRGWVTHFLSHTDNSDNSRFTLLLTKDDSETAMQAPLVRVDIPVTNPTGNPRPSIVFSTDVCHDAKHRIRELMGCTGGSNEISKEYCSNLHDVMVADLAYAYYDHGTELCEYYQSANCGIPIFFADFDDESQL